MNNYTTTVIKTGNSYALRVPKAYINDASLKLGQKVLIPLPMRPIHQNKERIQTILRQLQSTSVYNEIADPGRWQRQAKKRRTLQRQ